MKRIENGTKVRGWKKVVLHFKVICRTTDAENSLLGQ